MLGSAWGATQSGVQSLWSRADASGLVSGAAMDLAQPFQAEFGYGFNGSKGRALWVPFVGANSATTGDRALRLGVRLSSDQRIEAQLEIGQRANARGQSGLAVQLGGSVRW